MFQKHALPPLLEVMNKPLRYIPEGCHHTHGHESLKFQKTKFWSYIF
jgi:hypothetical protein